MARRIPLEHPAKGRYWRDRRTMEEMEKKVIDIEYISNDTDPERVAHYKRAAELFKQAAAEFRKGWSL